MNMENIRDFYSKKKVLITGHTGFIGSWLTKWLTMLDAEVCGYSLDPPTRPNMYDLLNLGDSVTDIREDIRNREAIQKVLLDFNPEIVFHLAAQPVVLESYDNPVDTFDVNVTGTVNLLNEVRKVGSAKVITVMTSDKSYRNNEWVYPYRENDVLGGKDPYSASKSCQDIVVNSFRESYFYHSGIALSSIRAGNVIGGGDWAPFRIIPDLVRDLLFQLRLHRKYQLGYRKILKRLVAQRDGKQSLVEIHLWSFVRGLYYERPPSYLRFLIQV